MHHSYSDICSRIPEPPRWWDENAVPRYCLFGPGEVADIYADAIALVEIACQACDVRFRVAFSWNRYSVAFDEEGTAYVAGAAPTSVEQVRRLHYGDPPNTGCCPGGATMNCVDLRVLEFWRRGGDEFTEPDPEHPGIRICKPGYFDWRRVPEFEIELEEVMKKGSEQ